jgi:hypothetical protein
MAEMGNSQPYLHGELFGGFALSFTPLVVLATSFVSRWLIWYSTRTRSLTSELPSEVGKMICSVRAASELSVQTLKIPLIVQCG